jgi:hypothetical protein
MMPGKKIKHPVIDELNKSLEETLNYERDLAALFGDFLNKEITDELAEQVVQRIYEAEKDNFFEILKKYLPAGDDQKTKEYLQGIYGLPRWQLKKLIKEHKKFTTDTIETIVSRLGMRLFSSHVQHHPATLSDYMDKEGVDKGKEVLTGIYKAVLGHPGADAAKKSIEDVKTPADMEAHVRNLYEGIYSQYKAQKKTT